MSYQKSNNKNYEKIPFEYQVSLGQFPRYSANNKFGYNNAVGTTQEEIWNVGGVEAYLSTAETIAGGVKISANIDYDLIDSREITG